MNRTRVPVVFGVLALTAATIVPLSASKASAVGPQITGSVSLQGTVVLRGTGFKPGYAIVSITNYGAGQQYPVSTSSIRERRVGDFTWNSGLSCSEVTTEVAQARQSDAGLRSNTLRLDLVCPIFVSRRGGR